MQNVNSKSLSVKRPQIIKKNHSCQLVLYYLCNDYFRLGMNFQPAKTLFDKYFKQ